MNLTASSQRDRWHGDVRPTPHRRAVAATVVFIAVAALAAGCSTNVGSAAPTSQVPPTTPPARGGVVAIGHSALVGEGSVADRSEWLANSWATGDNPQVRSIYARMLERDPDVEGRVANTAKGGASASALPAQAQAALHTVPQPDLVVVQTIDNDIRCDGTDAEHVPEFETSVQEALEMIAEASPQTKVLIVSQITRPSIHAQMRIDADRIDPLGEGPCDFFDSSGTFVPERMQTLTDVIVGYEEAQMRACARVANCYGDDARGSAFPEQWSHMEGADGIHWNPVGTAAVAEYMWPVVESVLDGRATTASGN